MINLLERLVQLGLQVTDLLALLSEFLLVCDDPEVRFTNLSFSRSHNRFHGDWRDLLDCVRASAKSLFFDLFLFWFLLNFLNALLLFAIQNLLNLVWVRIITHNLTKSIVEFEGLVPQSFRRFCLRGFWWFARFWLLLFCSVHFLIQLIFCEMKGKSFGHNHPVISGIVICMEIHALDLLSWQHIWWARF